MGLLDGIRVEAHQKGRVMPFFRDFWSALRISEQSKKETGLRRKNDVLREEAYKLVQEIGVFKRDCASLLSEISDLDAQLATDKASFLSQISALETSLDRERESSRAFQHENDQLQLDLAKANALIALKDHEKNLLAGLSELHKEVINQATAAMAVSYGGTQIRSGISPDERQSSP